MNLNQMILAGPASAHEPLRGLFEAPLRVWPCLIGGAVGGLVALWFNLVALPIGRKADEDLGIADKREWTPFGPGMTYRDKATILYRFLLPFMLVVFGCFLGNWLLPGF